MITVFQLSHVHEFDDGHEDFKLIGIYSSRAHAESALGRVRNQPGFRSCPEGFTIVEYRVDPETDGWPEGYVTAYPDGTFSE